MKEHSSLFYLARLIGTVQNWPTYLRLRKAKADGGMMTLNLRNGISVTSRIGTDRGAINEVWLDRIYDPPGFDWAACKTIIDVGANIGTFTLFAADRAKQAKIMSLEPDTDTAAVLRGNIEKNNLQNRVTLVQEGLAATSGPRTFYVTPRCSWFGTMYEPQGGESHAVTIQVTTLKDLFEKHAIDRIDFLKLDCEGAEYESLYGLTPDLLSRIDFIALEHHPFVKEPRCNPADLKAFLEQNGFTVTERVNSVMYAARK